MIDGDSDCGLSLTLPSPPKACRPKPWRRRGEGVRQYVFEGLPIVGFVGRVAWFGAVLALVCDLLKALVPRACTYIHAMEPLGPASEPATESPDGADEGDDDRTSGKPVTETLSLGGRGQGEGKSAITVTIDPLTHF